MDAIKFIKERDRMCKSYYDAEKGYCSEECPALNIQCIDLEDLSPVAKELVEVVEAWSAVHPLINRQMKFLSYFPNADIDDDGVLKVCPKVIEGKNYVKPETCGSVPCSVCRIAYWSVIER